jgi:glycogen synthase
MPFLTLYFQFHQPFRLNPGNEKFLWDAINRELFVKAATTCYEPTLSLFNELVSRHPWFKVTLGMSGTFLELSELFRPEVITLLQKLLDSGRSNNQVEFLDETYYHSLAGLFTDPDKKEFRDQVSLHRDKVRSLFGLMPTTFRNTDLIFNTDIIRTVADMGFTAILCERRDDRADTAGAPVSHDSVFRSGNGNLLLIMQHKKLSSDLASSVSRSQISSEACATSIADTQDRSVMLGFHVEPVGIRIRKDRNFLEFWRTLPEALLTHPSIEMVTPSEIVERSGDNDWPLIEISSLSHSGTVADSFRLFEAQAPSSLFRDIEKLETDAKRAGGELLIQWRHLTASDHMYLLGEARDTRHTIHSYLDSYGGSPIQAAYILAKKTDYLEAALRRFEILKKSERTAVLLIAPETGRLPAGMGPLAHFISGKSGGLGEVVSALCEGLIERNIDVHLATLNLKRRFQKESQIDEGTWRDIRYHTEPDKIHLISSAVFDGLSGAYAGDPRLNAAEFHKAVINTVIKTVRARSKGKLLVHTHDWMAGGAITAYAHSRDIPILHTVHNSFTGHIPLEMLFGIDLDQLSDHLYFSHHDGNRCIDCQATAIKNATLINFVGQRFLEEVVNDYFSDRYIIPPSVRQEVKEKYNVGSALAIINAPSRTMYPENCPHLVRHYGPEDDVLRAKRENLIEFQKRMGLEVNPEAILFYWPSRLDPTQKGVELLEDIMLKFVIEHSDVQIALVSDGVGGDRTHEEIVGRIVWTSGGKIAFHHFEEGLSMLGFAAASDVFGASLYEPCGQIDQVGNLFGATATNRDTGGYHDKIRELRLKIDGAPQDVGNGFLFRDYDSGGLWYGLEKSVRFHRFAPAGRETQIKRIMREARQQYDLGTMIAEYVRLYERLNGGKPLA